MFCKSLVRAVKISKCFNMAATNLLKYAGMITPPLKGKKLKAQRSWCGSR